MDNETQTFDRQEIFEEIKPLLLTDFQAPEKVRDYMRTILSQKVRGEYQRFQNQEYSPDRLKKALEGKEEITRGLVSHLINRINFIREERFLPKDLLPFDLTKMHQINLHHPTYSDFSDFPEIFLYEVLLGFD
ncbi:MAG: hypothetical protein WC584_04210 [Candidatus Pacearchaeota archaeon]